MNTKEYHEHQTDLAKEVYYDQKYSRFDTSVCGEDCIDCSHSILTKRGTVCRCSASKKFNKVVNKTCKYFEE